MSKTGEVSYLREAKKATVTWGGSLKRSYGDDYGNFAFRFTYRGETFIAAAKAYPDQGRASFMQQVARRAADEGVWLAEFFGEGPTLGNTYVFDPVTVIHDGEESSGNSKKDVPTDWYQLPLEKGVLLGDFVSRDLRPEPPGEKDERPRDLTDY